MEMKRKPCSALESKVNWEELVFTKSTRARTDRAAVACSGKGPQRRLYFNPLMVERCGIATWGQVVAGYDSRSGVIILKHVDAEELGAAAVSSCVAATTAPEHTKERAKKCRVVRIGHLCVARAFVPAKLYRAELVIRGHSEMLLLDPIREEGAENS